MSSDAVGPYEILEVLGRGGMGVVYRARHASTGALVALKTVRVAREGNVARLRREIHALARIDHPGIVRIVGEGVENGLPWFAMELVAGSPLASFAPETPRSGARRAAGARAPATLSRLLDPFVARFEDGDPPGRDLPQPPRVTAPPPRAELTDLLRLVGRVCETLAYLHGEGLVHRDLKPDNVIVRPDGMPVLIDFGLVTQFAGGESRDALAVEPDVAGTIAYIAPEQAVGRVVDARADLYALGCIIYRLLTGQPPFVADEAEEVLAKHLNAIPAPPSTLAPGLPPGLDDLVLALLAKEPKDRIGYADDVSARLRALGVEREDGFHFPSPRAYLYRPALTGREREQRDVLRELGAIETGHGSMVLLAGESGVGKTRLAAEIGAEAIRLGYDVLTADCSPATGDGTAAPHSLPASQALRPLLQAIADRCRDQGLDETERLLGSRGKILAPYEPALRTLPGQDRYRDPVVLRRASDARLRVFRALADTLRALALNRPLLLIFDDLQWADDLAIDFLGYMAHSGQLYRVPISVLATYRTEEATERLQRLCALPGIAALFLPRLDGDAVAEMVADMLGRAQAPPAFLSFLARESEGNPSFIAEYLRAAVTLGILYRDSAGAWQVAPARDPDVGATAYEELLLPHNIRDIVARRFEALAPSARRLAQLAAVLGRDVDTLLLADLAIRAGCDDGAFLDDVGELFRRQILEESDGTRARFVHNKLRDVAYALIEENERGRWHVHAAELLEDRYGSQEGDHLPLLADHWDRGGVAARAMECYLRAARQAIARYAQQDAERLYRRYLALAPPSAESVAARHELADRVLRIAGKMAAAIEEYRIALPQSRDIGDPSLEARCLRGLGALFLLTGEHGSAHALYEEALAIARQTADATGEAGALEKLGVLNRHRGDMAAAETLLAEALARARESSDARGQLGALANLATVYIQSGRHDLAREHYGQGLELAKSVGDRLVEGVILGNLATLHHERGNRPEAEKLYEEALAIHREVGDRAVEGHTLGNLGICRHQGGDLHAARELYEQALAISREVGDRAGEGGVTAQLAALERDEGNIEEALSLCLRARDLQREVGDRSYEATTLQILAAIHRQGIGDHAIAAGLLDDAHAILLDLGDRVELAKCLCQMGHLALARGTPARELLTRAERLAAELGVAGDSELGAMIAMLAEAVGASESGFQLFRGELPERLPEGLWRWLVSSAQIS